MNNSRGVRTPQPLCGLPRDLEGGLHGQWPVPIQAGLERFTGIKRHGQEQPPVFGLPLGCVILRPRAARLRLLRASCCWTREPKPDPR